MAEKDQVARDLGVIPNREESIRKFAKKLTEGGAWAACYEAGPTGYALYWQLTKLGIPCVVIAPTLVPTPLKGFQELSQTGSGQDSRWPC